MTTATIDVPLYSEAKTQQNGEFSYTGDLHRPLEGIDDLVARLKDHLARTYPDHGFTVRRSNFAGGFSLTFTMVKGPAELMDKEMREAFFLRVRDQVKRFGRESSNYLSDYTSVSFYEHIEVGSQFLLAHTPQEEGTEIRSTMTLAEFKKRLKVGDVITLVATDRTDHKALGIPRAVVQIRSKDFIVEPKSYCDFPKAAAFACDGSRFRISDANAYDPNGYRIYEWKRS